MRFTRLTIFKVPEEVEAASGYVARVFAAIEEAPAPGFPLRADLGDQPVEGFGVVDSIEPLLSGYLKAPPEIGDELVITIADVVIPTGLTVEDQGGDSPIFA